MPHSVSTKKCRCMLKSKATFRLPTVRKEGCFIRLENVVKFSLQG